MTGDQDHVANDLAELKGIGPKYAAILKELPHRNASLNEKIETRYTRRSSVSR